MRGVALLLCALAWAAAVEARVLDFHTDIRVAKTGELTVTERLTLEVDARHPHSVLLRELPAGSKVLDVIRNGHPEPYAAETIAGGVLRLRIGSGPLDHGRHLYQVAFRTQRSGGSEGALDRLTWRLDGGDFGAERVTAEIALPAAVPARDIRVEQAKDQQSFVRDGRVAFRTTRALAPSEVMTIAIRFPQGVVATRGFGFDEVLIALAVLALIAAVVYRLRVISVRPVVGLGVALALAMPRDGAAQVGVNIYGASYHLERERAQELGLDNEFNPGLGARYRLLFNEHFDLIFDAGVYRDSARHTAVTIGAGAFWKATEWLRLGGALALFKSPTYNAGEVFLAPLPIAALEFRRITFNTAFAPRISALNDVSTLSFWLTYWP